MSFTVLWDYPAETVLLKQIGWPTPSDVAVAVHRFARERAPALGTGPYRIQAPGHAVGVWIDRHAGTVLVLYLYRVR